LRHQIILPPTETGEEYTPRLVSLAVGFSMVTSYILSSTFVPVMSTWLLRHQPAAAHKSSGWFSMARLQDGYAWLLRSVLKVRWLLLAAYLAGDRHQKGKRNRHRKGKHRGRREVLCLAFLDVSLLAFIDSRKR
jgi:hypothetical protein